MFSLTQTSGRQREILEIVLGNGWDYMRNLLTRGKSSEVQIPPPAVLRKILTDLGPFYVKLGQLLSTRPDLLPPDYIESLSDLQAKVPTVPWSAIEQVIQDELSQPMEAVFSTINPKAIAAGSIAQIHRATLTNGERVALKVQRPGIDKLVAKDSKIFKGIAELATVSGFAQNYNLIELTEDFTAAVLAELDFTKEAKFTNQLRSNLNESRWFDPNQLTIPKVYLDLSTEKLLVLEWLEGEPILEANLSEGEAQRADDIIDAPVSERNQAMSRLLFRAFFQQIYVDGFFHADPHPGNIFYLGSDRLALLDCGMIGRLDPRTRQLLTEMLLAILDIDAQRCAQVSLALSDTSNIDDISQLENNYDQVLRKYYNLSLEQLNFSEVFFEILQVARENGLRLPGNLGLFAKSLANLEGVARTLNPKINVFEELEPLVGDLFQRQLIGNHPFQTIFRTILDLKSIFLKSPRQVETLLDRLGTETLQWNVRLKEIEPLRRSIDDSANRLSFSILVGSLIMGAAITTTQSQVREFFLVSEILFAVASILGLWLIFSILRSGRLR